MKVGVGSALALRVSAALWGQIVAIRAGVCFRSRSRCDLAALRAVFRIVRTAERERRAKGCRMAILRLPTDRRQLYWLERLVEYCAMDRHLRRAARRLLRRTEQHSPGSPLAQALYQRYSEAPSSREKRSSNFGCAILSATASIPASGGPARSGGLPRKPRIRDAIRCRGRLAHWPSQGAAPVRAKTQLAVAARPQRRKVGGGRRRSARPPSRSASICRADQPFDRGLHRGIGVREEGFSLASP
jgi:hypothetical protein